MRIRPAITVTAFAILLGSLAAGAIFNSLFFHRFLVGTYDARLLTVALDVRDVFARAVALGLPLNQFDGGNQIVAEARKADPAITGIIVYQGTGDGFTTLPHGGIEAGQALPEDWARAMRRAPEARYWQIDGPDGFGVLVPISSTFGKVVGLAAFLQSRTIVAQPQRGFDEYLILVTVAGGIPGALVLLVALPKLIRSNLSRVPLWSRHAEELTAAQADGPLPSPPEPGTHFLDEIIAPPLAVVRRHLAESR